MESLKIINFNCGGEKFSVSHKTISKFKDSILFVMINGPWKEASQDEIFIDKDPVIFRAIINFMRNDELFIPPGISKEEIANELDYYNIPCKMVLVPINDKWLKNNVFVLAENVCESFLNSEYFQEKMKKCNTVLWEIYSLPDDYKGEYLHFKHFISACLDIMIKYLKSVHELKIKESNVTYNCKSVYFRKEIIFYHNYKTIKFDTSVLSKEQNGDLVCKKIQLSPTY